MDIEGQKQNVLEDNEDEYKEEDQTSYFLQCKVCREQYDEQMKKPLILPCGHTFCSFCIDNLQQDGIIICPLDKKTSTIQDSLILNYAIIEALNEQSTQNQDVLPCKIHPKEIMKFYCEDDQKLICQECLLESHIGHKIKPAEEYIDLKKLKFNAKKFLIGLENNEKKIIEHKEEIYEEQSNLQCEIEKCKDKMKEAFEQTFNKSVKDLDSEIDQLNTKTSDKLRQIQLCQNKSQELQKIIEESKNEKEINQEAKTLKQLIKQNQSLAENLNLPGDKFSIPLLLSQEYFQSLIKCTKNPYYDPQYFKLLTSLKEQGVIKSDKVLKAMQRVNRKNFVKPNEMIRCYHDQALPIGWRTTISAPHMHAHTFEALKKHLHAKAKVLDIGFGSGYLCAAFAELIGKKGTVYGVDHIEEIKDFAQDNILKANKDLIDSGRVQLFVQDGRKGFSEYGPVIHVGGAIESIPKEMKDQLAPCGRLFAPVGSAGGFQTIVILDKDQNGKITEKGLLQVLYGMLGDVEAQL